MFLANASTQRPIAMSCLLIALIVLGLNSYRKLSIEDMPAVDIPYVAIITTWIGASPEDVEKDVSKFIEGSASNDPSEVSRSKSASWSPSPRNVITV